jgi:hypothetical protein
MKIAIEQAFQKHFQRRFSLRLHMFIILLVTALSGVLFSKILLMFDVVNFAIRYPLAVVFSYLIFFACIKLWLICISPSKPDNQTSILEWLDLPSPSGRGSGGGGIPSFRGGGGQFSGAGASGSFAGDDAAIVERTLLATAPPAPANGASGVIGEALGETAGALGDDNIVVAVIVLIVLVGTVLASTLYVLFDAPTILSEAAFEGFLAASLIRRARAVRDQTWVGSIFRATWKPFAVTVGVAFFCGLVLHSCFPNAVKLADILWKG